MLKSQCIVHWLSKKTRTFPSLIDSAHKNTDPAVSAEQSRAKVSTSNGDKAQIIRDGKLQRQ